MGEVIDIKQEKIEEITARYQIKGSSDEENLWYIKISFIFIYVYIHYIREYLGNLRSVEN